MSADLKRKKVFVEPAVQGVLVIRCIVTWAYCVCISGLALLSVSVLSNPGHPTMSYLWDLWVNYRMLFGISVAVLLIAMVDFVRISNRFCGPVIRLRREMTKLVKGEHVKPMSFRDGDYWQEFAVIFNEVASRIQAGEADLARSIEKNSASNSQSSERPEVEMSTSENSITEHSPVDQSTVDQSTASHSFGKQEPVEV